MEVELKLLLDPLHVQAFRRQPLLKKHAVGKPGQRQLVSIYFDTPDLYFRKHEAAIRVRKIGRRWVQTFKAGGKVEAGLHQRHEWESVVDGPNPDLNALIELAGRRTSWEKFLSAPGLAGILKPVFTTRFRRTTWMLHLDSGTEIELALDQGVVQHGDAQTPLSEIELELKAGDPAAMFDFALQLQQEVPLRVSNTSKADRGYALQAPQPSMPVKAVWPELSGETSVEQGFEAIVHNCLSQVEANEAAVEQGDPEGVHQMRVGLRRLRSALRLFDEVIHCPDDLRAELRWLAGELGGARDWHVFSETLASVMRDCPDMAFLPQLRQAASDITKQKEQEAAESVGSIRYSRMLLMLGAWINGKRWRESPDEVGQEALDERLHKFAERALARFQRRLLKRGELLRTGTPEERHEVRIAAKRARYSAEFFQSLYPARRIHRYIDAMADLQEVLGQYQDDITAGKMLEQFARVRPGLAYGCGFVEGYLAARTNQWGYEVEKPWNKCSSMHLPQARR